MHFLIENALKLKIGTVLLLNQELHFDMRCEANHSEFACGNSFFYIFLVVVAIAPYNTSAILGYAILHGTGQYLDSLVSGKIEVTQRQRHFNCMLYVFFISEHSRDCRQFCAFADSFQ